MVSKFIANYQGYWREPNITGIPAKSGVYTVYVCTFHATANTVSLNRLIYIGESKNVRNRIASHEKWPSWKKHLQIGEQICISFAPIGDLGRERVEAALIFQHKPPENREYVSYFPFPQTTINTSGKNALLKANFTVWPTNNSLVARR